MGTNVRTRCASFFCSLVENSITLRLDHARAPNQHAASALARRRVTIEETTGIAAGLSARGGIAAIHRAVQHLKASGSGSCANRVEGGLR